MCSGNVKVNYFPFILLVLRFLLMMCHESKLNEVCVLPHHFFVSVLSEQMVLSGRASHRCQHQRTKKRDREDEKA